MTPVMSARFAIRGRLLDRTHTLASRAGAEAPYSARDADGLHDLVPAWWRRRRLGRGGEVVRRSACPRLAGQHGGRLRSGRHGAPRAGHGRRRPTHGRRGTRRTGPGRPRRDREPLFAPSQPRRRHRRRGRLRRPARTAAPSRPAVATRAAGRVPTAARRRGVGTRHDQRAEPQRAGVARHHGDGRLQHLRPRSSEGPPRRDPRRPPRGGRDADAAATDARAAAQERRGRPRARRRPWAARTGCSARPRTATGPSWSAWCARRAVR